MAWLTQQLAYALQQVAVIVEALLTVALVARQRVLTAALLADFFSEQSALVNVCRRRGGEKHFHSRCVCTMSALCQHYVEEKAQ